MLRTTIKQLDSLHLITKTKTGIVTITNHWQTTAKIPNYFGQIEPLLFNGYGTVHKREWKSYPKNNDHLT